MATPPEHVGEVSSGDISALSSGNGSTERNTVTSDAVTPALSGIPHAPASKNGPKKKSMVGAFVHFLNTHAPTALVKEPMRQRYRWLFNYYLQKAAEEGAQVSEIRVNELALPEGPYSTTWNPVLRTLDSILKIQLDRVELAQRLGPVLRTSIVKLANRQLAEAAKLNVPLEAIFMNNQLLLEWEPDHERHVETDEEIFDTIELNNPINPEPIYSTQDEAVYFTAGVVGGDVSEVEFVVIPATDADEAADLPELEFAVDRMEFEYCVETDDGIDVEFHGTQVRATGDIFEIAEIDNDGMEVDTQPLTITREEIPTDSFNVKSPKPLGRTEGIHPVFRFAGDEKSESESEETDGEWEIL